ncbi:hypothetical protein [Massilia sp. BKSP1R2A-1]|uniref:hypothetical protein n=1 Tax=Massilia sp. BKSP1R2A-1 TaxID=3422595 RepID=UPI003D3552C4
MPRKSAAIPAAAKAVRAKAAVKAKPAAKAAVKSAAKPAAKPRTSVKTAVKAAAGSLAAPAAKRTRKVAQSAATAPAARDATRPVLVRDSFTMPEQEYAVLAEVKGACLRAGIDVKKSELLRIGVALLGQVDIATLKAVLAALPQLKTGRPPAA